MKGEGSELNQVFSKVCLLMCQYQDQRYFFHAVELEVVVAVVVEVLFVMLLEFLGLVLSEVVKLFLLVSMYIYFLKITIETI
jgi:hypothetical protein